MLLTIRSAMPGGGNVWKLGEGNTVCIFPLGIPACC